MLLRMISKDMLAYVPYLAGVNLNLHVVLFAVGFPAGGGDFRVDAGCEAAVDCAARGFDGWRTWHGGYVVATARS